MDTPIVNLIGFCSGIAGLELGVGLGLEFLGYRARTLALVEREAYPANILRQRMEDAALEPCPIWCGDLESFPSASFHGMVDCLCAGFPCPPVSVAGAKKGMADERWILPAILDAARAMGARWLFLENVSGLRSANQGREFGEVLRLLAESGYGVQWLSLEAADVGAAHRRDRVFFLCWRIDAVADPEGSDGRGEQQPREQAADRRCGFAGDSAAMDDATWHGCEVRPIVHREDDGLRFEQGRHAMANASRGLVPEPGRGPQARDGAGSGGEEMGNTGSSHGVGCQPEQQPGIRPSGAGEELANPDGQRCREAGRVQCEPQPLPDRRSPELAQPALGGFGELREPSGGTRQPERSGIDLPGVGLADSRRERPQRISEGRPETRPTRRGDGAALELPIFAPGPSDPQWPAILAERPHLAPAIVAGLRELAASESGVVVDESRADQLRCLGNQVVAAQAAAAFIELVRRINT